MSRNNNYLAQLNAARSANKEKPDLEAALSKTREYSEKLKDVDVKDLRDLDDLLDKVDSLSGIFEKYAKLQEKIESLKANAVLVESAMEQIQIATEEAEIDPFTGYTQDQTYAINVQLIHEFESGSRLSKDLLNKSAVQVLEDEVPDDIPAFEGLTKEQTVQVYMQVMDEFENKTALSDRLAYNAGVA